MGHQENREENKQTTEVDDPISPRLGFSGLLGGPNEDFEFGSEGQQIPRPGRASSKAWGCEVLPSSGEFKVKAVVRDGSRKNHKGLILKTFKTQDSTLQGKEKRPGA